MLLKKHKRFINLTFLIAVGIISGYCWYRQGINMQIRAVSSYILPVNYKNITSIQYQEKREAVGAGNGMDVTVQEISYIFPDKLRIETGGIVKVIEIYNNNKYIYYDSSSNKAKIKECFPPDKPYVSDVEKKIMEILGEGEYEFFGYEDKNNKRMKVIGVKSNMDGHSYMHKLWIGEERGIILPFIEEYFIDNTVVSRSTYTYLKVNEPVDNNIFEIASLPSSDIIDDGVMPKFVDSFGEAQKYLSFKLIVPKRLPAGFIPSEIGIIPPVKKPSFYCIYFNNGYRIYLNEKSDTVEIDSNAYLGEIPCKFDIKDRKVFLIWRQNSICITLSGDEEAVNQLIDIAEQISGGKFIKNEDIK